MITQTSEYALRAVVVLALNQGGPQTTAEVARRANIPSGYLSKVLRMLARAGILHARRGIGGGFTIARPPDEITMLDVLEAVDSDINRNLTLPEDRHEHPALGAMENLLTDLNDELRSSLGSTTFQTLIEQAGDAGASRTRSISEFKIPGPRSSDERAVRQPNGRAS